MCSLSDCIEMQIKSDFLWILDKCDKHMRESYRPPTKGVEPKHTKAQTLTCHWQTQQQLATKHRLRIKIDADTQLSVTSQLVSRWAVTKLWRERFYFQLWECRVPAAPKRLMVSKSSTLKFRFSVTAAAAVAVYKPDQLSRIWAFSMVPTACDDLLDFWQELLLVQWPASLFEKHISILKHKKEQH